MIKKAARLLKDWNNILVLSHASPDGDTLGSASALIRGLKSIGKNVRFACSDKVDKRYNYLFEGLSSEMNTEGFVPDKVVTVDVADRKLLGKYEEIYGGKTDLAIDHHGSHKYFAAETFLDANSASNCENIYKLLLEMGIMVDRKMGQAIFTGMSTDTGCFKYSNVTPETHEIAAELMRLDIDAAEINRVMFDTRTRGQVKAEVAILDTIEYFDEGKIALITITSELMEKTGIFDEDIDMFVSIPRQIEGVLVGITLKERGEALFKVSVRTNQNIDASAICGRLGGGGHNGAAGCSVRGNVSEVKAKILTAAREQLL